MSNKHYYTSKTLISSVKRRSSIPEHQNTIKDNEILEFANEEMQMGIIPLILAKHQDFYITREVVPVSANKRRYKIPSRAIGNKLKEVALVDESGNFYELFRVSVDDIYGRGYTDSSRLYFLEHDEVVFLGDIQTAYSIVFFYYMRPNSLVEEKRIGKITNINHDTGVITFLSVPQHFNLSETYDFIKIQSPHRVIGYDITAIAVNLANNTITVDPNDIPEDLSAGDHVGVAGETDLINCPSDLHVMLAQRVSTRILEALGDLQNLQAANAKLAELEKNTGALIDNRVDGAPLKVRVRNGLLNNSYAKRKRTHRN